MNLALDFIEKLGSYIKDGGCFGEILDKPNAHRLFEQCLDTFPVYLHSMDTSKLVFKCIHHRYGTLSEKIQNMTRLKRPSKWLSQANERPVYMGCTYTIFTGKEWKELQQNVVLFDYV